MTYECARCQRNFTAAEEPETYLCPQCIISHGAVGRSARRNSPCPECKGQHNCHHCRNPHGVGSDHFLYEAPLSVFRGHCDQCGKGDAVRYINEFYRMCQHCFETPPPILCSDCGKELKPFDGYYRCPPCDREVRP